MKFHFRVGGIVLFVSLMVQSAELNEMALNGRAEGTKEMTLLNKKVDQASIRFLIRPKKGQEGVTSIFSCDGWQEGALHLLYLDERTIQFSLNGLNVDGEGNDVRSRIMVPAGTQTYVHVAIVFDGRGKTMTFYKNGNKTKQFKINHAPQIDFEKRFFLGSWEGRSRFFNGNLADFKIDEKVMSEADVRQEAESYKLAEAPPVSPDHTAELKVSKKILLEKGIQHVVFVKRNTYTANHYYTEYINSAWLPGGNVCVLDVETGKVRDVVTGLEGGVFERFDLSYDAKRIVFAWKGNPEQGHRIYEVNVDGTGLRQLTFPQADEAELIKKYRTGYHHGTDDMQPCYLPDGSIAFVSTRCQFGILCDMPDNFTTTVLHRMDSDGKNIQQLSRGSVSEATPSIMPDGRILYTRWEYVDKGAVSVKCLWAMRPDGTASSEVYGNDIALPPTLNMGRVIPGAPNQYVVCGVPHFPQNNFGTVIRLDMNKNIRSREPMTYMTPQVDVRGEGGWEFMDMETKQWRGNGEGLGPLFSEPYPLSMDCFLVSYKPTKEGSANQANGYGLYLLDDKGGTTLLYRDPEISCWRAIPLVPRKVPPVLSSPRNKELAAKTLAQCMVQNVYHGLSGVAPGTIKYIRVLEQMGRPWAAQMARATLPNGKTVWCPDEYDQQHICVSKDTALGLKVQHGVVPVEADGSANFLVPATGNVFFQVLDEHYMAVQTERTFVNYMPGESRACIGCHETPEDATRYREIESSNNKGQPLAFKRKPSSPGPQPGEKQGGRPLHYETDVQPVFDKHCVSCHSGKEPKGGMSLSGERTRMFSVSYESLVPERRRGPYFDRGVLGLVVGENHPKTGNVSYLPAYSLGSTTALLSGILGCPTRAQDPKGLVAKHAAVAKKVTQAERLRVTNWIDTNCQYYGSYWYRRNKEVFATHPDFRRVPTYEDALRTSVQ